MKNIELYKSQTIIIPVNFRHLAVVCEKDGVISRYCTCGALKDDKIHYKPHELHNVKFRLFLGFSIIHS